MAKPKVCCGVVCLLLLALYVGEGQSRSLPYISSSDDQLVSDGIVGHEDHPSSPFLLLKRSQYTYDETCERFFSFLPCTDTLETSLFLIALYGYMLFIGENHISGGRESLYKIMGNGWCGAALFHILTALPLSIVILFSKLFKSKEKAQEGVSSGVGVLAGSTIMYLTLIWGTCVLVARNKTTSSSTSIESEASSPQDSQYANSRSLVTNTTDKQTNKQAAIMVLSVVPFIILQLPQFVKSISDGRTVILIALITSIVLLLSYLIYQEMTPWIKMRKLEYVKHKYLLKDILKHLENHALGNLFTIKGAPNLPAIRRLIRAIDQDNNEAISTMEFQEVLKRLKIGNRHTKRAIEELMNEFHTGVDNLIDETEYTDGLEKIMENNSATEDHPDDKAYQEMWRKVETDQLVEEDFIKTLTKAVLQLLFGMFITVLLSEPFVGAVEGFSTAANIPPFFVAFVVVPLATKSREAVSAISTASRKTPRTFSLTLSEIYSGIFMNNLLSLSVSLTIAYLRGLTWNFSAEVLVIFIVCMVIGLLGSFRRTFPLWTSFVAYLLYPFSLLLAYVLDYTYK